MNHIPFSVSATRLTFFFQITLILPWESCQLFSYTVIMSTPASSILKIAVRLHITKGCRQYHKLILFRPLKVHDLANKISANHWEKYTKVWYITLSYITSYTLTIDKIQKLKSIINQLYWLQIQKPDIWPI